MSTTRPWAAALALWLAGCGQPEAPKAPDLVQPVWGAPEAEAPPAAETGSDTSGSEPASPAAAELDAPAPGAEAAS
ncbi:MAG TPA: hypothetical protein VJU61_10205, partial [Polyangiaceae bacterium]|nr:hypothetical protein [Polyangiaceae bacterium]